MVVLVVVVAVVVLGSPNPCVNTKLFVIEGNPNIFSNQHLSYFGNKLPVFVPQLNANGFLHSVHPWMKVMGTADLKLASLQTFAVGENFKSIFL